MQIRQMRYAPAAAASGPAWKPWKSRGWRHGRIGDCPYERGTRKIALRPARRRWPEPRGASRWAKPNPRCCRPSASWARQAQRQQGERADDDAGRARPWPRAICRGGCCSTAREQLLDEGTAVPPAQVRSKARRRESSATRSCVRRDETAVLHRTSRPRAKGNRKIGQSPAYGDVIFPEIFATQAEAMSGETRAGGTERRASASRPSAASARLISESRLPASASSDRLWVLDASSSMSPARGSITGLIRCRVQRGPSFRSFSPLALPNCRRFRTARVVPLVGAGFKPALVRQCRLARTRIVRHSYRRNLAR